ncbi:hypothetical protein B6D52_01150 [Candidatus Parcubacteria bacterium 4484_255]|nr:MAG: hypothetical protein B6D52_01150 [Candidatus Parcubacteria bacterium 4484_255]
MENVLGQKLNSPETEKKTLSEGMQLIVKKLQKTKESGFSVLDGKEYKEGVRKEEKVLEAIEDGPQSTIIKANKLLCEEIVNNPEKLAA